MACGSPTGATLLKHRHLRQLGYALVVVPYWEWDQVSGDETAEVEYLRSKLDSSCVGEAAAASLCQAAEGHAVEVDEPRAAPAACKHRGKPEDRKIKKDKDKSASKKRERDSSSGGRWTAGYSKKRGQTFYFNCATGESRWEKPAEFHDSAAVD